MNPNIMNKTVGDRLKYLRKKNGESQEELGASLGVSQKTISNFENGITSLPLEFQIKYAEHYNVSHDYLCTGRDNDSILELLKKYISLEYSSISVGNDSYDCPVLHIDKALFECLIHFADIARNKNMPENVRELYIKTVTEDFYKQNKNNSETTESIVPVPVQFISPDDSKKDWKQTDLLREMDKQFL